MNKILIINPKPHTELGGIESYTSKLIQIFLNNGYKVFELSQMPSEVCKIKNQHHNFYFINHPYYIKSKLDYKKYNFLIRYIKLFWISIKVNWLAKKIIKQNEINIVIDNNLTTYISFIRRVKYFWIQHFNAEIVIGTKIRRLLKKILFIKDRFNFPNIITFTKKDVEYLVENHLVKIKKQKIHQITPGIVLKLHTHTHKRTQSNCIHW
ncbi:glycosyltransferase family protein [Mycoplasmoides alvi]|uniref:hypothetical protein n=1 Tax=Mycoplasmoides alvi TaxID=78580 RepID=UPI00051BFD37|nr:hypothetical protein [Mycoplasmoides alvi]